MHKEAIELFRKSASRILEDAKVYCESGYEAHSIEEKACFAAIIQFLPCFIESKPLVEHKDIYIEFVLKRKVFDEFHKVIYGDNPYPSCIEEAYEILKLTSFSGPFEKESFEDRLLSLKDSMYENISNNELYLPTEFFDDNSFFGDTSRPWKHGKKSFFDKKNKKRH